jgi:hypothetical protein
MITVGALNLLADAIRDSGGTGLIPVTADTAATPGHSALPAAAATVPEEEQADARVPVA